MEACSRVNLCSEMWVWGGYISGMEYPANGTILALCARWRAWRGVVEMVGFAGVGVGVGEVAVVAAEPGGVSRRRGRVVRRCRTCVLWVQGGQVLRAMAGGRARRERLLSAAALAAERAVSTAARGTRLRNIAGRVRVEFRGGFSWFDACDACWQGRKRIEVEYKSFTGLRTQRTWSLSAWVSCRPNSAPLRDDLTHLHLPSP